MDSFQVEDLFDNKTHHSLIPSSPLAVKMSPVDFDSFVGQKHILSAGKLLRRLIESDRLQSVIFHGPSGTGKSALARIIAHMTASHFEHANAVTLNVGELRKILDAAKRRISINAQRSILLIDEIHHFNRSQQDALLPDVETGSITLIGITTENPYFYVNAALLSRSHVFEFFALEDHDLEAILQKTLTERNTGFGALPVVVDQEASGHLIRFAAGDARRMLNALEVGVLTTKKDRNGKIVITLKIAEESMQKKTIRYDKKGDSHYDTASAFIKSMRGSDPDAALYWMAKMLKAGEDPRFIIRRVIILASEDIGNADPRALVLATAALQAIEFVGMPEARIPLAHAVIYAACAPKSNACYAALQKVMQDIRHGDIRGVPDHLKDASLDTKQRGHGAGYQYPHDHPGNYVPQEYLPGKKKGRTYYTPGEQGFESEIKRRLEAFDMMQIKK